MNHQESATEPSFEESTRRLADIVAQLESGELTLERSLALFEEGVRLARTAQTRLDVAEKRVEELLAIDAQGNTSEFGPVFGETLFADGLEQDPASFSAGSCH